MKNDINKRLLMRCRILMMVMCIPLFGQSQFSISSIPPQAMFTFEDLWNVQVTFPAQSQFLGYYIAIDIHESNQGYIMNARTRQFTNSGGPIFITRGNITSYEPIEKRYFSAGAFQSIVNSGGYFPAGNYQITFSVYGISETPATGTIAEMIATSSYQATAEWISPPVLIYPYDGDTLIEKHPTFTWAPPFPIAAGQNITYKIKIAEVLPFQSPLAAMQSNPLYASQDRLIQTLFVYPVSAREFSDSMTYAWQVDAYINDQYSISSEVWAFGFRTDYDTIKNPSDNFILNDFLAINNYFWGQFNISSGYLELKFFINHDYYLPTNYGISDFIKIYNKSFELIEKTNYNITILNSNVKGNIKYS